MSLVFVFSESRITRIARNIESSLTNPVSNIVCKLFRTYAVMLDFPIPIGVNLAIHIIVGGKP